MLDQFCRLCRLMAKEEWRLHNTVFNGERFALLPVVFATLALAAAGTLSALGVGLPALGVGVITLAFILGLQTGTLGFESRDGVENVMGEATFLLFSSRTLPISARTTVAAFLVKDMAYYAALFISPLVLGTYAGAHLAFVTTAATTAVLTPGGLLLVGHTWLASTLVFLFGVSLVLVASGEVARNLRRGSIVVLVVTAAALVGVGWKSLPGASTMGGWLVPPLSAVQLGLIFIATVLACLVGILRFSPTAASVETKPRNEFSWLHERLGSDDHAALAAKMVMDVHRSSGGIGKLLVSSAIILAAVYVVLQGIQQWLPLTVSPGIVFSVFLSVTAVPTYLWLTQLDDVSTYQFYPVSVRDVFTAKAIAFVLLATPVAIAYYASVGILLQPSILDLVVGGAVLAGVMCYLFGITVYLTGLTPNESLFDAVVFGKFTLAGMVVLIPFLIVGFFTPIVTPTVALGLVTSSIVAGTVGIVAYRNGAENWTARLSVRTT